jgi:hypothetical protein
LSGALSIRPIAKKSRQQGVLTPEALPIVPSSHN